MIYVIYEDNHIIVVNKPINVPSQQDETKDIDILSLVKGYIKEKENKPGNVYLGLIHRLDRPVGGLMVFAKTSKAAKRLSKEIINNAFIKTYHAILCGVPKEKDTYIDYLVKDEKNNKSYVMPDKRGKESILSYELIDTKKTLSFVKINLKTGRHHQIRVQFSYHGFPLWGDQKYNPYVKENEQIALFASELSFNHPITKETLNFKLELPKIYPWDLFM